MATCPRCGTTLKEEYGMSQCPKCGAFSFIDMDGLAVISEPDPASAEATAGNERAEPAEAFAKVGGAAATSDFSDPIEGVLGYTGVPEVAHEPNEFASAVDEPVKDASSSGFNPFDPLPAIDSSSAPESAASTEYASTEFQSFDNPFDSLAEPESSASSSNVEPTPPPSARGADFGPANDPLNLNDFANSEVSSAKDGPLLFRVLISGIDAKEIRESIREVIEDSRFAWDSNEIFSKISKGHLVISGLSPVKASILITRIKRLPISIRWEQYAITQGPGTQNEF